jgi:nucleoside-diphosphate-sugar epimerase
MFEKGEIVKIFIAGGTGTIGKHLIPLLVASGHSVVATTRMPAKTLMLRTLGAHPIVLDGLDKDAVLREVRAARPDAIVHQMTALASVHSYKKFDEEFEVTNRLRTAGTAYLLSAAQAAGVRKFVAQSYTGWPNQRQGSRVKTEEDPLDSNPPKTMARTREAIRFLEQMVTNTEGITGTVLRYGSLYGPDTSFAAEGEVVTLVRQHKFPLIGDGAGVWSFIHVADAARATQLAIERNVPGIYNIVDDEPAEVSVWLPDLARALGARPPRHLPAWMGRLAAGEATVLMMTKIRGSSNAKAKRTLGWSLEYPSWRVGFRRGLAPPARRAA